MLMKIRRNEKGKPGAIFERGASLANAESNSSKNLTSDSILNRIIRTRSILCIKQKPIVHKKHVGFFRLLIGFLV